MKKYYTAARHSGNVFEEFYTFEDAVEAIERYEDEDRAEGIYTPNFYDVVDEKHNHVDE